MSLAAALEQGVDHLGIYCTSGSDLADTCLLSVAVPLSLELLRTKLEKVPQRPRHCYRVEDAFLQAAQALRTLRAQHRDSVPSIKDDIIVITPSASSLPLCDRDVLEGFRVHLFNPSLIPYPTGENGRVASMFSTQASCGHDSNLLQQEALSTSFSDFGGWVLDSSRCLGDDCNEHRSHYLTDIVAHARSQTNSGTISNVSIKLHSTNDAVIEAIMGETSYESVSPGQMISLAVCVELDSLEGRVSAASCNPRDSPSHSSMLDAISDLEMTLGNHLSELFEIEVSYNHSFFPINTRLSVRESCWLPCNVPPRRSGTYLEALVATQNGRVQKQLALCIASSRPPAQALREMQAHFPANALLSEGVSNFLDALRRRLKHRAALLADASFMDYFVASEYASVPLTQERVDDSYLSTQSEMQHAQHKEEDDATYTPTTIVRRAIRDAKPSTETDEGEARRIWQQIRRTSRRDEQLRSSLDSSRKDFAPGQDAHEPHIEEIRETALKHGRKISAATLRSLAKDFLRQDSSFVDECEGDASID